MTLLENVAKFIRALWKEVKLITGVALPYDKATIESIITSQLEPIFAEMFRLGREINYNIVDKNISNLIKRYNVPVKYDRYLLDRVNGKSIFSGYFDEAYYDLYSKSEIDKIKRTILRAKYSNMNEKELRTILKADFRMTEKRAQIIARGELQRLDIAAAEIYYEQPEVKQGYDLVWETAGDDRVRENHKAYDGKKADKDGYFNGPNGKIKGPQDLPNPWNCRCRLIFVKKQ